MMTAVIASVPRGLGKCRWGCALLAASALVIVACPAVDNPFRPLPEPSYRDFVANVQPVIEAECAFPGCHGTLDRPLTLYARGFLRAPPVFAGTPLDDTHLTDEELAWNYDAMRVRIADETSADDARLLLKCLDTAEGGIDHAEGIVVFRERDDPGYEALLRWIEGGL